jgi:malonate-semialdehyde dehydrogenase (acetylating)/methylmalonate-semialdehyde dehydrogenase
MSTTETLAVTTVHNWIGGKPEAATSGRKGMVHNPATGEGIAEVGFASAADVDRAVAAAKNAFRKNGGQFRCQGAPKCCSSCAS